MTEVERYLELKKKIIFGLQKTFENVLEFKRQKNSELVIMRGGEIVRIKPEDFQKLKKRHSNTLEKNETAVTNFCKAPNITSFIFSVVSWTKFAEDSIVSN
jgi:hypothetical protein